MPVNPLVSAVVAGAIAGGVELIIMYPLDVSCSLALALAAVMRNRPHEHPKQRLPRA